MRVVGVVMSLSSVRDPEHRVGVEGLLRSVAVHGTADPLTDPVVQV